MNGRNSGDNSNNSRMSSSSHASTSRSLLTSTSSNAAMAVTRAPISHNSATASRSSRPILSANSTFSSGNRDTTMNTGD